MNAKPLHTLLALACFGSACTTVPPEREAARASAKAASASATASASTPTPSTPGVTPEFGSSATGTAPFTTRHPDDRERPPPTVDRFWGRPVTLGLSYEISQEWRKRFDLSRAAQRTRSILSHELKLDAQWPFGERGTAFIQAVGVADQRSARRDDSVTRASALERGQTWLRWDHGGSRPWSLQVGRIALIEPRSWWWDEDLDALRLSTRSADGDSFQLDVGLARELARVASNESTIAPQSKGVVRGFGHARWRWAPRHRLDAFALLAHDGSGTPALGQRFQSGREDGTDARLRWLGLRAQGEWRFESQHRLSYRADTALLRGTETRTPFTETDQGDLSAGASSRRRVRGQAYDLGLQWRLPGASRPTFSLGLAQGSGGTRNDSLDANFRQTGLQDNKGRLNGVKRVRYYGELLDPSLSNLRVATLGFGLYGLSNSSIELLAHQYRQVLASTTLSGSRLSVSPRGLSPAIGHEFDLVLALREWQHLELTLRLSQFHPGEAFAPENRAPAHSVEFGAVMSF